MFEDSVLKTIGSKNIIVVSIVNNRYCENGYNMYFCWDELNDKTMLMSVAQLYTMNARVRNVFVENIDGEYKVYFDWCSKEKVPVVTAINGTQGGFEVVQDGIWLLRRYKGDEIDTFDSVNALGVCKRITADEVLRLRYSLHIVNATIIMKHNLIRGTLKAIPIIDKNGQEEKLKPAFNNILKGLKDVAFVIRSYDNNREKHFRMKVTAQDFNKAELDNLFRNGTYEYIEKDNGYRSIVVGVNDNFDMFLRFVKVILNNAKTYNMVINCYLTKNVKLDTSYTLRHRFKMGLTDSNKVSRDTRIEGNILIADDDIKSLFSDCISTYYRGLLNNLRSIRAIDTYTLKGLSKEYAINVENELLEPTIADAKNIFKRCTMYTGKYVDEPDEDAVFKCLRLTKGEYNVLNKLSCLKSMVARHDIDFVTVRQIATSSRPLRFKYVTSTDLAESILKEGLKQKEDFVSSLGLGVYVVGIGDVVGDTNLRNYVADIYSEELIGDSDVDICILTGEYIGVYHLCIFGEGNEGFILLEDDVPSNDLNKLVHKVSAKEYIGLK